MGLTIAIAVLAIPTLPRGIAIAPMPHGKRERLTLYLGTVVFVDKSSITIRGRDPGNKLGADVTQRFGANDCLIEGRQDPRYFSRCEYRLSDVKVGDRVFIFLHPYGNEDLCVSVRIERRPGGKVPPAPFEDPDRPDRYHDKMNAKQAFEEKGIPLPPHLDPVLRQFPTQAELDVIENHKKWRARQLRIENHTAPMPRAVKRSR